MLKCLNVKMTAKGFTLVEILVAVGLFLAVTAVVFGAYVFIIRSQVRALAQQELLNQTSYAMEYMSRALRMAKKDLTNSCLGASSSGYNYWGANGWIRFLNYKDKCQEFSLSGGRLRQRESSDSTSGNFGMYSFLTSSDFSVSQFLVGASGYSGWSQGDAIQASITFLLDISGRENTNIRIQTTVSQRDLDVRY